VIGEVIRYLKSQGDMAIILVEQYFDFAFDLADQFYAMKRGEVILSGPKQDVSKEKLREAVSI
jgi:urea transport system ATP-binding protein